MPGLREFRAIRAGIAEIDPERLGNLQAGRTLEARQRAVVRVLELTGCPLAGWVGPSNENDALPAWQRFCELVERQHPELARARDLADLTVPVFTRQYSVHISRDPKALHGWITYSRDVLDIVIMILARNGSNDQERSPAPETGSVAQYVERTIDFLKRAERKRESARRLAEEAVAAGRVEELRKDPNSVIGTDARGEWLSFRRAAGPLVNVAYALRIEANDLETLLSTGDPQHVPGAIRALRLIQAEDARRQLERPVKGRALLRGLLAQPPESHLPVHIMPAKGWLRAVAQHAFELIPPASQPENPEATPRPKDGADVRTPAPSWEWASWWIGRVHAALNLRRPLCCEAFTDPSTGPSGLALNGLDALGNHNPPRSSDGSWDRGWPYGECNTEEVNPFTGVLEVVFFGRDAKGTVGVQREGLPLRLIMEYTRHAAFTLLGELSPPIQNEGGTNTKPADSRSADGDTGVGVTTNDWKDVQNRLLGKRERGEPFSSLRVLAAEFRCSDSTIRKAIDNSDSLKGWRSRGKGPVAPPKATDLGDMVRDNTPQKREPAPEDVLPDDEVDAVMARLIDKAGPVERAKLNAMGDAERRKLAAAYQSQNFDHEPSPLEPYPPGKGSREVKHIKRA